MHNVEVQEESQRLIGELEVGQQLSFMYWKYAVDAFELDNHHVFNQQIDSEPRIQL